MPSLYVHKMSETRFPKIAFCPYLPLQREVALGPWRVAPVNSFRGAWLSSRFRELAEVLINAHGGRKPALIYHAKLGAHGRAPSCAVLALYVDFLRAPKGRS